MTLSGTVKNGVVIFDDAPALADGTKVQVTPLAERTEQPTEQLPTLHGLLKLAGTVKGLPPDFAAQHDHYIHGTPKR